MTKKHYPAGDITPHGAHYLLSGRYPLVTLHAHDESIEFSLMGGKSIPDRTQPEVVVLKSLKGLIPPWTTIDQKGATQDGITFVDALYDPMEVEATVIANARDPKHLRTVVRDLIASIDVKQTSELSFITQEFGRWWANVRWFKTPPNMNAIGESHSQELALVLRADDGFWRTYDDVSSFEFDYADMTDTFDYDTTADEDLGDNWPLYYDEAGGGYITANGHDAVWIDDPSDWLFTESREVVAGPYKDFETETDNQVCSMVLGSFQEWSFPQGSANDLWCRMGKEMDGTWNGDGIRMRIENNLVRLSRFNDFTETLMAVRLIIIPPLPGEKFTLVAGYEGAGNTRLFKVMRNGFEILSHRESGTGSEADSDHRGIGFGMQAGGAILTQATPGKVRKIAAGDNSTVSQSGYLRCFNIGDQPMYREYTLFGPGKFKIGNGPGSADYVEFGPLLPNQVAYIRTDPRRRTVKDLTSIPPTPQELTLFQQLLKAFVSFASGNNVPPLLQSIESLFGIRPPQGNFYSLLNGRFTSDSAIPPKSPGNPAKPYFIKCTIDDGNADSKIVCSGTPLRRYPT
jgi:tail protein